MCELTVVIPMYQSQETIESCVNSILSQGITNLEVVCVDDGSKDETCKVVKTIMEKDRRVQLIEIGFQGVSQARNAGLDKASGKYVLFVDSDDMILPNMLKPLLHKAISFDADILVFGGKTDHPFHTELWMRDGLSTRNKVYTSFSPEVLEQTGARPFPWNKLFKKEFLNRNEIYFDPDINSYGEDHLFQFIAFSKASRIIFTDERAYYYRILRPKSVTTLLSEDKEKMLRMHILLMEKVFKEYDKSGFFKNKRNRTVYTECAVGLLYGDLLLMSDEIREELTKQMVNIIPRTWGDKSPDVSLHTRIETIYLLSQGRHDEANEIISHLEEKPAETLKHIKDMLINRIERFGIESAFEHYVGKYIVRPIYKIRKGTL